MFKIVMM